MRYYGLHFVGDEKTPVQVRVSKTTMYVEARSCPNGQWTSWRRLDVMRNPDGTLAEETAEATHAKSADVAGRLKTAFRLRINGAVSGETLIDGSQNINLNLYSAGLENLSGRVPTLEAKVAELERIVEELLPDDNTGSGDGDGGDI